MARMNSRDLFGEEFKSAKEDYLEVLLQREMYWKQRAKTNLLREEDQNSRLFHTVASKRMKKNSILRLKDNEGVWREWGNRLEKLIEDYFNDLFSSSGCLIGEVVDGIANRLTTEHCAFLDAPFTKDEIKNAVFRMDPYKALGSDGFNPMFFQKFWDVIASDVESLCLQVLNSGVLPQNVNDTLIVLIPKEQFLVNSVPFLCTMFYTK